MQMATLTTLVSFDGTDGDRPTAGLIVDAAGDLFGTTWVGGPNDGAGTVFEIPYIDGGYASAPTTLISFNGTDGADPAGNLITDVAGDLFGTTEYGGTSVDGTVFEIPFVDGSYASAPTTLGSFGGPNGAYPVGGLIADAAGALFGTTNEGGANGPISSGGGTAFEISYIDGSYASAPTTLVSFNYHNNGGYLQDGLIADAAGDLFGTTWGGGPGGGGTAFEVPYIDGSYASTPTTLVSFSGNGLTPYAGLIADAAGDLFGTTTAGGADGSGTVFEIPYIDGSYASTPTILVSFNGTNGADPYAGLIADAAGDLFGTTNEGGTYNDGTVFEIPYIDGSYASMPTTLVSFNGTDGANPEDSLAANAAGDLFGTTVWGGANSLGTTFEVTDSGYVACYCAGTRIATPAGEVPVETLAIADRVVTQSGEVRPVKWIGRRSYGGRFIMDRKDILPICIKAEALDENVPKRDLWISPHHAMYLEGVLIEAKDLVNGVSIAQAEHVEKVEYFHIELDSHDVIVAEGALSETFIDDDSRAMFHNAHDYQTLYPYAPALPARYCAPRHEDGYEVEVARQRIAERAGLRTAANAPALRGCVDMITSSRVAGWAQNVEHPEAPVCLDIYAGGELIGRTLANRYRQDLERAALGSGCHSFAFTPPVGLTMSPDAVEVRRSLDGTILNLSLSCKTTIVWSGSRAA
jgi:hypothetical protein